MAEGFDPSDAPVSRGRRDPQIQMALEAEDHLGDASEGNREMTFIGLAPGDVVAAKVTHAFTRNDGGDSWFSYGVQSRILDGENEEDAFVRVATVANERVLDLADDAEQRIGELVEAQRRKQQSRRGR